MIGGRGGRAEDEQLALLDVAPIMPFYVYPMHKCASIGILATCEYVLNQQFECSSMI